MSDRNAGRSLAIAATVLLVVELLAGAAAVLVYQQHKRGEVVCGWRLIPVFVAKTDLKPGQVFTGDELTLQIVPARFVTISVVKATDEFDLLGRKLRVPLHQGDTVRWVDLEPLTPAP